MTKMQVIRKERGFSQAHLAELTGIKKRQLEKLDNGENSINRAAAETVLKIADALGVDPRDLME